MSQATAARPLPVRRAPRGSNPTAGRTRLKLVQPAQTTSFGGVGFVVLCAALVVGGLLTVLLLNTARAQQQYTISDLQAASSRLAGTDQDLNSQLDTARAPQQLALQAQALGLVPANKIRYVREGDHRLLGVANGAAANTPFTVGTLPKTPASAVAGLASSTADKSISIVKPKPKPAPTAKASTPPAATTKSTDKSAPTTKQQDKAQTGTKSTTSSTKKSTDQKKTEKKSTPATPTATR